MRSLRTSTRKVMKIRDRIYGKKHGLDRVWATRHQTTIFFFDTSSAQGDWGWSSGQATGSTSCAGVSSRVNHARVRKTLTQACVFFL
jgi:hypothetical protein